LKQYLTVNDLSKIIGRSPAAVRNLVLRRRVPFRKPGGRLLFLPDEIERWVEESEGIKLEDLNMGD